MKMEWRSHSSKMSRDEEMSKALQLGSILISPTWKLNLKQSSDRPAIFSPAKSHTIDPFFFFFCNKALKMLGNSDGLSHEATQILHTHSCWCPTPSLGNNTIFSVFGKRNILSRAATCLYRGGWVERGLKVGAVLKSCDLWDEGVVLFSEECGALLLMWDPSVVLSFMATRALNVPKYTVCSTEHALLQRGNTHMCECARAALHMHVQRHVGCAQRGRKSKCGGRKRGDTKGRKTCYSSPDFPPLSLFPTLDWQWNPEPLLWATSVAPLFVSDRVLLNCPGKAWIWDPFASALRSTGITMGYHT